MEAKEAFFTEETADAEEREGTEEALFFVEKDDAEGAKLVTVLDILNDEVFAYLFEGKQAQLSLFGDNQEPDNENDGQD